MDTVDNDDIESVPKVHRHADAMSQRLKTLDKNFEERVNMVMRTNADTVNECTNIVVAREDAVCMFRRGEISIAEARRAILNIRMRAASENVMTPSVEAPSGYHQGFVSVRTPYDQVGANYRKWVVLDYEHDGRPVMRICNRRNGSPDEVIRDVVCWFTPESCVIPYCNTAESKISSEEEVVTELSLSIDGVYMSTGTSEILRNRYQVVMSFCVKNMDVMMQWYRAIVDIIPTTLDLAHEGGVVPENAVSDLEIETAAKNLRARYGRHYEMTKLLNLRTDDDFCASLGMWKPLNMESLKFKLKAYYSEVCPGRKDVKHLVAEAARTYFHSQQLLHYHLQDKYGVSLFEHMPPPVVARHVRSEPPKDTENLISMEEANDRPELRPDWNHISDTYGYFLSGTPLKGARHRKVNKDIVSSTSPGHHNHHPLDAAPRRTSMLPWKSSSNALKKKSSSRADLSHVLSRQSLASMGSEKSLTSSTSRRNTRRSHASSSGSVSSTPSSIGREYEDLIQYEIMIRGSHWTWSGGLPFPNVRTCVGDKEKTCKHCKLHKTMIAENYKCYVRILKLENSPQAETNARPDPQRLEHTSEENLSQNPMFPASILLELSPDDVHHGMLRFEVCLRNMEGRSHFVMARMEIRASSLLCRPLGSEITMTCRSGTWPGRLYVRILPPLWSSLSACPTTRPMGRSYMFRNDRLDRNIFVREEALEPHLTYLVPSQFFRLRHEELLHKWAKTKSMWNLKYRKSEDKFDSVWLDKEFREEYKKTLYDMAMSYADLSARYRLRHVECVPFRSSRQKAKPEWIQGIPVNLHLSLMSTARLRCLTKEEEKLERERLLSSTTGRFHKGIAFVEKLLRRTVIYARTCCSKRAAYFRLVDEFGVQVVNENWRIVDDQLDTSFAYAQHAKQAPMTPSRIKTKRTVLISDEARSLLIQKFGRACVEREESTESSSNNLQHDGMRRARRKVQQSKVELSRYGQISWGAPTIHHMGYEHGGLSEMYGNEYIKEERRLKQVQENTFNRKQLISAEQNIKELQKLLESYNLVLSQLRSPQQIDEARMNLAKKIAEEKSKNDPDAAKHTSSSFFSRIVGSHHETITPEPRTLQEAAEVEKWNRTQSQVQEQKHKLDVINNVRSSLLKKLDTGVNRARKMLRERELNVLKLSQRRDFAVSMALTALTYGFTFHLQQIADNPSAMKELSTVGFLAYFENLLSAADLPGAAHDRSFTQDQICASEALQLVAFKIVSESAEDEEEKTDGDKRSNIRRRDTLRALRTRDQDRKSVDRNKSQISKLISREFIRAPPPSLSPPETPEVSTKLDSISERTDGSLSPGTQSPVTSSNASDLMSNSESTRPLLSGRTPSVGKQLSSHSRVDSVEAEVEGLIEQVTTGKDEQKIDETSPPSRERPLGESLPVPPPKDDSTQLRVCDSVENLRNELSDQHFKKSLEKLTPPSSLHNNERFEFPDPKGDPLYTEYELHPYHKRIFWDHGEDIRIARDPVQVRLRLRKSSKYTEGITQNAYIDPTSLRQKRKSSYGTAKKFQGLEQYDSSFEYDLNVRVAYSSDTQKITSSNDQNTITIQVPKRADSKSSNNEENKSDTHFAGWLEKMGQKQGLLGGSRYKKRWIVLLNGTLTWYSSDAMTKRKGRLHVEAYKLKEFSGKDIDSALEASFGNKELVKFCHFDGKYFNFELQRSSEGGNLTGMRSVKDVVGVEQNEELFEGQLREKLTMRTNNMGVAFEILSTLEAAIKKYKDRSSNYCIRFAGLQLMRPPTNMGTEDVRISTRHETLALEPMRQLVVRVVVPDKLYARLLPCLKRPDKLIRARPILFTQGISSNLISATQRSLQGTSMLAHRNGINEDALVRLEQFVDDLKNNASKDNKDWSDRLLRITSLLQELKVHLERAENKTNPIDGLPALLVASDLSHVLGGLKFVNCMSGKDRTGMSVTLEQSRQLMRTAEFFGPEEYSYSKASRRDKVRTAQEIATTENSPGKHSKTLDVADRMRISGPRVQICRKSIHKAKFKGSISLFCMKPPKNIAGDVEA